MTCGLCNLLKLLISSDIWHRVQVAGVALATDSTAAAQEAMALRDTVLAVQAAREAAERAEYEEWRLDTQAALGRV